MRYRAEYCNDKYFTAEFEANGIDEAIVKATEMHPEHWLSDLETVHELTRNLYMVYFDYLHDDGDRTPTFEAVWAWCPTDAARRLLMSQKGKAEVLEVYITTKTSWRRINA